VTNLSSDAPNVYANGEPALTDVSYSYYLIIPVAPGQYSARHLVR